ncbi:tetratricopeptide repeat protein [Nocardia sp. CDC159]|uniref:Tetratricopeptide repeat protein n=1 Tax=Nocardia pulmonis TaxID=2951408 RepID=A0A9X2ECD4_9NOCA|nr:MULTISPECIES: tetratricopeptide repeat protein [Nocardia]MCM6778244.1 tetratricopeptide repeat protein [Nocardia pulmonis]MCM6791133.1 tetratricopeptide repeat protein [Nocardia sp. CDC159]
MVAEVPRQLPPWNSNHVDREDELDRVERLVRDGSGNVTVIFRGARGVGTTSVATAVMHRLSQRFPDGQLFYPLADGDTPPSVSDLLADGLIALGDRRDELPDLPEARYGRYLTKTRGRRMAVFVDGALTAGQVRWLCPADGPSLLVITARNAALDLGVGTTVIDVPTLPDAAARELLIRIVGDDRIDREPEAVNRILALCDNLPAAICVVGGMLARHPQRSIARVAELLNDEHRRSEVLGLPEIYDAAYEDLSDDAKRCYLLLGLRSHAGWLRTAAIEAALGMPRDEIDWAMLELAEHFLVVEQNDGYRAVSSVRTHARSVAKRLGAEQEKCEENLIRYFDRALCHADVLLAPARPWRALLFPDVAFPGPGVGEFDDADAARTWLRSELANIAAAAEYAFHAGRDRLLIRWCVLLWAFHEKDKHLDAMRAMHLHAIAAAARSGDRAGESLLRTQLGFLHYWLRELAEATIEFETAAHTAGALDGSVATQLEASALEGLGLTLLARQRPDPARAVLRRNLELAHGIGDTRRIALASLHLAKAEDPDRALDLLAQADAIFGAATYDETENRAKVLAGRGRALVRLGRWGEAETALESALAVMRERRRRFDEAEILVALGDCRLAAGSRSAAVDRYRAGLEIYDELCFTESAAVVSARVASAENR